MGGSQPAELGGQIRSEHLGLSQAIQQSMLQDSEFDLLQLEGAEQEELEARKILTKRRRRVGKIEDVQIDIEALFAKKKRFKPDDSTSESVGYPNATGVSNTNPAHPDLQLHLARQSLLGGASSQTRRVMQ